MEPIIARAFQPPEKMADLGGRKVGSQCQALSGGCWIAGQATTEIGWLQGGPKTREPGGSTHQRQPGYHAVQQPEDEYLHSST